ncbi:MAG: hypothetical protein IPG08_14935 [Sphingobacteriaceae bacterium]|nr:hypothetical protein [Sphingobacteriaceae bacterium]
MGIDQGDCVSFPQRNEGTQFNRYGNVGPDQIDQINMYLAALALEYKILSRNNQDTKETIKEIYEIVETYNRLDEEADQFWVTSTFSSDHVSRYSNDRNGFMLRGDMPEDYFRFGDNPENFLHFNYGYKEYNNINPDPNTISYSGLSQIDSLSTSKHFSNYNGFVNNVHKFHPKTTLSIPHDKYYSMFFAFMFIVKYLPDNLAYVDEKQRNTLICRW